MGRLTKVKNALNQETAYSYDELSQQLSQTDANNHATRFEYDQLGRLVKRILPGGQFETYAYDTGGNLQYRTDFNGKTTTFTYDLMRRLLSKVPDASLNQPTISFSYNQSGHRATMTDASGTSTYNYDPRNRLTSESLWLAFVDCALATLCVFAGFNAVQRVIESTADINQTGRPLFVSKYSLSQMFVLGIEGVKYQLWIALALMIRWLGLFAHKSGVSRPDENGRES